MPVGQLYIWTNETYKPNYRSRWVKELGDGWVDAYKEFGMSLDESALSALMTPPPNKACIENSSRLEHGKRVINNNPKIDSRSVTLTFNLTAKDVTEFMQRYAKICEDVLACGYMELITEFQEGVKYKMQYESCTQFSQFMRSIGKFSLKLTEPDPTDRS